MSIDRQAHQLRIEVSTHLDRLQELTTRRNVLLHLAVHNPRPSVARALRFNRLLADQARRAARLARAQLSALEMNAKSESSAPQG